MKVSWTGAAREDLAALHGFLARDSQALADITVDRILMGMAETLDFPLLTAIYKPAGVKNIRRLLIGTYGVIYLIDEEILFVLAVIYGARDPVTRGRKYWDA